MQLALAGSRGEFQQGMQQPPAHAMVAKPGQHHQGEFGRAVLSDVLGMALHVAVVADRQHRDAIVVIDGIEALQQRLVRRLAMREMALVKSVAVHRGEKADDAVVIPGTRRAHLKLRQVGPRLTGAHGRSPATKSTLARITAGSSSTR